MLRPRQLQATLCVTNRLCHVVAILVPASAPSFHLLFRWCPWCGVKGCSVVTCCLGLFRSLRCIFWPVGLPDAPVSGIRWIASGRRDVATPTFLGREASNLGTSLCPALCWGTSVLLMPCLPRLKPWDDLGEYVGPCLVCLGSPWGLPWDDLDGPTPRSLSPRVCVSGRAICLESAGSLWTSRLGEALRMRLFSLPPSGGFYCTGPGFRALYATRHYRE